MSLQSKPWLSPHYCQDLLPDPLEYYAEYRCDCIYACDCGELWCEKAWVAYSEHYREWHVILCPFHEDEDPSMSVNIIHGAFKCFACGVKGCDVLSFHRQLKKLTFIEAARQLGAWRN